MCDMKDFISNTQGKFLESLVQECVDFRFPGAEICFPAQPYHNFYLYKFEGRYVAWINLELGQYYIEADARYV